MDSSSLSFLSDRIQQLPYLFVALLAAFTLHEYAHAAIATLLGDPYPKREDRLTLNPLSHIDPQGFLLMIFVGVGWTKPVYLDEGSYKSSNDYVLANLAGPLMNLLLAFITILLLPAFSWLISLIVLHYPSLLPFLAKLWQIFQNFSSIFIQINIFFLLFNLLPLPNLDGFHLWKNLSGNHRGFSTFFENPLVSLGFIILIITGIIPINSFVRLIVKGIVDITFTFISYWAS